MRWSLLLLLLRTATGRNSSDPPEITSVSAMCSSDGITASVDFDGPFNGKIYSLDYATVNDCLYYNALDMDTILFSIPAHRCGTRLSRTTRNIVDQMVNRVYVQMDRDFQSAHDKQFSFVCQLADGRKFSEKTAPEIRRAPQRDPGGYATPPPLSPAVTPIKALSMDARQFGNWPISGSKPYDAASMKPAAVFPRYPVSPAILPVLDPGSYVKPVPQKAPPLPQYIVPTQFPVLVPQKNPVVPFKFSPVQQNPVKPVATSYQLPPPPPQQPSESYARPPAYPTPQRSPAIVPSTVNKQQGIGMGFQTAKSDEQYTKIPAQTWNIGTTTAYGRQDFVVRNDVVVSTVGSVVRNPQKEVGSQTTAAKVFKEEPKRVGVAFTSDENNLAEPTISVSTEPLTSRQETRPTDVFLEIQRGEGPFSPAVAGPVRIGENISLVVRSATKMEGEDNFDMFVHSCFATDGPGMTKVQLTDEKSCVLRNEFVDQMRRTKSGQQQFYFFRIAAFKFPGPDDVYFSCSIELTPNRTAPEICPPHGVRWKREIVPREEVRLFDIVKVELAEQWEQQKRLLESCISPAVLTALCSSVAVLLVSLLLVSSVALRQHFRLRSLCSKY